MKGLLILVFAICTSSTFAQNGFQKLKSISLPARPASAAIDRVGELYVVTENNFLVKYDINGEVLASDELPAQPDIFDPRDGSHAFLYWREPQRYELRLPDLKTTSVSHGIDSSFAVSPFLVCPSGDHDILILDSADWSLKKISTSSNAVLYETIVFEEQVDPANLLFMREYQNFIFILERGAGIHVFNRMGKLLRTIKSASASWFNFLGEEIYFPEDGKLRFFDLFTAEERTLSIPHPFTFALLSDERLFVINERELTVFTLGR